MKKETAERFKNPQQRKKFFQEETGKIQVQLASVSKDCEDAIKQKESNLKKIADFQGKEKERAGELQQIQERIASAEKEMLVAKEEKKRVAHAMKDALFQKNEVEAEISSINTKYKAEVEGLEKIEPIF